LQILEDTGILVFTSICTSIADILENTGNTSIADTGKYWLYQYCRYLKIR
jgi:hypothetical protein